MSLVGFAHDRLVVQRRGRVLAEHVSRHIPAHADVLDVGCGDGLLARMILDRRRDLRIQGLDVLVRRGTHIPVQMFDGRSLPSGDGGVDVVLFVDVLHHAEEPNALLHEASRVARSAVVIKDHTLDGWLAGPTLRFMDWVGNARHGVRLPCVYWSRARWEEAFHAAKLRVDAWQDRLGLYQPPASWIFERSLHFLARLTPPSTDG